MKGRALGTLANRDWKTAWNGAGGYWERAVYVGLLLLGGIAAWGYALVALRLRPDSYAEYSRLVFSTAFRGQLLLATFVAVPAFARSMTREKDRDSLDLLIMSPLTGFEILLGKSLGVLGGILALLAAGLPVFLFMLPLGGMAMGEIFSAQVLLVGHLAAVGGVCAALAPWTTKSSYVMLGAWGLVFGFLAAPLVGRNAGPWILYEFGIRPASVAPVVAVAEAIIGFFSPLVALNRELSGVSTDFGASLGVLGKGLALFVLLCGAGGAFLARLHMRQKERAGREGFWRILKRRIRRAASARLMNAAFRPLLPVRHPLMRHECSMERDVDFRLTWLAHVFVFVVLMGVFHWKWGRLGDYWKMHAVGLAAGGAAAALLVTVISASATLMSDRRKGAFEVLLAANVEPDDIVRSRLAGTCLRGAYLMVAPLVYGGVIYLVEFASAEALLKAGLGLCGLAVGLVSAVLGTIVISLECRSTERALVGSVLVAIPFAAVLGISAGAGLKSLVASVIPILAILLGLYAWAVRRFRKFVLST